MRPVALALNSLDEQAAAIFDAYPRKAGGRPARDAIKRALGKVPFDQLLKKTEEFAKVWASANGDLRYCPHPAKWYAEERYADDPATWRPAPATTDASGTVFGSIPQQLRNLDALIIEKERERADTRDDPEHSEHRRALRREIYELHGTLKLLRAQLAAESKRAVTRAGKQSSQR